MTELHRTWVCDVSIGVRRVAFPARCGAPMPPSGPSLGAALQPAQLQLRGKTTQGMSPDMYLQHLNQLQREANLNFYARAPAPITPGEMAIFALIGQSDGS